MAFATSKNGKKNSRTEPYTAIRGAHCVRCTANIIKWNKYVCWHCKSTGWLFLARLLTARLRSNGRPGFGSSRLPVFFLLFYWQPKSCIVLEVSVERACISFCARIINLNFANLCVCGGIVDAGSWSRSETQKTMRCIQNNINFESQSPNNEQRTIKETGGTGGRG